MRRSIFVVVLLVAAAVQGLAGHSARAQPSHPLSPAQQTVSRYLLTPNQTPSGLRPAGVTPLDNVLVAALAENPADVQKVIDRARLDGLEQDFNQTAGSAPQIEVQVSLYRDSVGASADVPDPTLLAGLPLTAASAPMFGDTSAAFQTGGSNVESTSIVFSEDRLEVLVGEVGPPGSTNQADIMPLARLMETRAKAAPPAPSPEELAVLQTETQPETILYDAYELLLQNYLSKLQPSQLLTAAFNGASKALSAAGVGSSPAAPPITADDQDAAWSQFLPAYQALEKLAPSSISASDLAHAAATELYNNLDCQTASYRSTDYRLLVAGLRGDAQAAVGVLLQTFPGSPHTIVRIGVGSPADRAGLQVGDEILAVDGMPVDSIPRPIAFLTGPIGSQVTLRIQRTGLDQPFDVTLTRQLGASLTKQPRVLPGGIGYIELNGFPDGGSAYDAVSQALRDFAAAGNVNSWILDLRLNGGGSEQTMERVAGLFVPAGSVLATDTTQDGTLSMAKSIGTPVPDQRPMVVLIGAGTGSGAAVFAQALKDLGRARLVGDTTSGCAAGGLPLGLLDGSGVFVSTIAVRAGPNGVDLQNSGVVPDVLVQLTRDNMMSDTDPQLDAAEALLRGSS